MKSKVIKVQNIFDVSYLTTREAAQKIIANAQPGDCFDFDGIGFASSAFVDEFIDQLEQQGITVTDVAQNLNPHMERLFEAVLKRRQIPVRA